MEAERIESLGRGQEVSLATYIRTIVDSSLLQSPKIYCSTKISPPPNKFLIINTPDHVTVLAH